MAMFRCLLATVLLAGLSGCKGKADAKGGEGDVAGEKAEAHVTVKVEAARQGALAESVEGLGRCEALPDHLATLTPAVEGHVHELLLKQGDPVKKGQAIVQLDETTALADLAEKSATRDSLKAALDLLKAPPRAEDRRSNELAIEQAKVAVDRAKRVADRLRPLLDRREVSDQQVFDADQAVVAAKLLQQTAEAALKLQMVGPRPEAISEAEAKVKTAEGAVALSQAHLDYHTIRSPIDGVLDSLTCHPGQTIAIGTVGRRGRGHQAGLRRRLALAHVGPRRQGRPGRATSARPRSKAEDRIAGKVAYIGKVADAQTGNLPVHVLVENTEGRLTLGESTRVSITLAEAPSVLMVPALAVVDKGEGVESERRPRREGRRPASQGGRSAARGLGGRHRHRPQGGRAGDRRGGVQPARRHAGERRRAGEGKGEGEAGRQEGRGRGGVEPMSTTTLATEAESGASGGPGKGGVNLVALARPYFGLIVLTTILLTVFGVISMLRMPSGIYPEVAFPRIIVIAQTPGLAVKDVEVAVTRPIEEAVSIVIGVNRVRSKSVRGASQVDIDFVPGTDMIQALNDIRARMAEVGAQLPAGTTTITERQTPSVFPIISFVVTGGPRPCHAARLRLFRPAAPGSAASPTSPT